MIRFVGTIILTLAVASLLSCQSYSTGLKQSLDSAGETSVIMTLKTISTTQQSYAATHDGSYGSFQQLSEAGYLDSRFNSATPQVGVYVLSMNVGDKSFSCNADPAPGKTGSWRHFYIDSTSDEIHANRTQPANPTDPGLGQ